MTSDRIEKNATRGSRRDALGSVRGGIRAAAKKVVKKVAKKADQKRVVRKVTAAGKTTGRTTRKTAKTATKKPAPARDAALGPQAASAMEAAATHHVTAASENIADPSGPASTPSPHEAGPAIETLRPPAPMHPGASMDMTQEHGGGLGSHLALWGPLIIVGFLVLVFRGGDDGESPVVVADSDAQTPATAETTTSTVPEPRASGVVAQATGSRPPERAPGFLGAARGGARGFDEGFTMRTSMANAPPFADRGSWATMPEAPAGRLYPPPPGPYRDPRYRGLPTGESWPAAGAGEWLWPAGTGEGSRYEDGSDSRQQWVRCAPPYYWCPAPTSAPAW